MAKNKTGGGGRKRKGYPRLPRVSSPPSKKTAAAAAEKKPFGGGGSSKADHYTANCKKSNATKKKAARTIVIFDETPSLPQKKTKSERVPTEIARRTSSPSATMKQVQGTKQVRQFDQNPVTSVVGTVTAVVAKQSNIRSNKKKKKMAKTNNTSMNQLIPAYRYASVAGSDVGTINIGALTVTISDILLNSKPEQAVPKKQITGQNKKGKEKGFSLGGLLKASGKESGTAATVAERNRNYRPVEFVSIGKELSSAKEY